MPVKITFAGENTYKIYIKQAYISSGVGTYQTNALGDGGRKCIQDVHGWDQPLCQSVIAADFKAASKMIWKREEAAAAEVVWDMDRASIHPPRRTRRTQSRIDDEADEADTLPARLPVETNSSHQTDPWSHGSRNSPGPLRRSKPCFSHGTHADNGEKHLIQFSEKFPGANEPGPKLANTGKHVLNLASYNFTGLAGNETIKVCAIETSGSMVSVAVVLLDSTVLLMSTWTLSADFSASILYSQGFSTIPCVISAFAKRGDIIVADWGIDFTVQKGLQISRSTGIFEKDGAMVDLQKPIELKEKYKYHLILDESVSFGTVGRTGRGLTELYNVPENVYAILAVLDRVEVVTIPSHAASPIIHIYLRSAAMLSAPTCASAEPPEPATPAPRGASSSGIPGKERLLQGIVGWALVQGVWTTQARRLRGQELVEARPSIWLAVTAAFSRKECERAAGVIKATVVKVLTKRK
ncbi:hypothetical protein EDB85DRAFT_2275996 [Lactarius pseudohatsudake]|nr:hypothetical protein EDB85DRAFT_2275996 [Lactarius pseudohatsudake]